MTTIETATSTVAARSRAEKAAHQRLLNSYLRESGTPLTGDDFGRIALPSADASLVIDVVHRSGSGHHSYGDRRWLERSDGERLPIEHEQLMRLVLDEVEALAGNEFAERADAADRKLELAEQVESSIAATARYLRHRPEPVPAHPHESTRQAEQSLVFGHPFHPTPKSTQGFGDDLELYAPELGASFVPHWFAVDRRILLERRVGPGKWTPDPIAAAAKERLGEHRDHTLLPAHPWQARYLLGKPQVAELVAEGKLVDLGPMGAEVYPTSSVRTVCDPSFPTSWKLPLHVRITNFVRNNPVSHLVRATDASALVAELAPRWEHAGFTALAETGFRTVDPAVVGDDLAADFSVLYRDNPFADGSAAPRVLAGLLEDRAGDVPHLIHEVRSCAPRPDRAPDAAHVAEWLRRYLAISLLPLLEIFDRDGVGFEAHAQNSLLHTDGGWPTRFWVRDMEGTSVSRKRLCRGAVASNSPLLYDDDEAWLRLRYYAVTNHLSHLIAVLGQYTGADESFLWHGVREVLTSARSETASDLLARPMLPAKANLLSHFAGRGETPLYVEVPNPLFEVNR
ncbi:hypothetical protein L0U85_07930 [Glycomyces sp. L485]|uniref:IucA/IucC family protein n=1 Tax=Glycomyces sp. L485 TaxID=2909235 RepID=UPI001F4A9418|nr:IucA/IucC family protein [Glycomyces sp. L485]MCH7230778.1 hypothetical protein [Glycomyces sp. L485]